MVEGQILNLPVALVMSRSVGPVDLGEADGNIIGCAITRNLLGTQWYASDFRCPRGSTQQQIQSATLHFGPYATQQQARWQVDPLAIEYLDSQGTNGTSLWLTLPV